MPQGCLLHVTLMNTVQAASRKRQYGDPHFYGLKHLLQVSFRCHASITLSLVLLTIAGCSEPERSSRPEKRKKPDQSVILPEPAPKLGALHLIRDAELVRLVVGKRIADGPVSYYSNFLPSGRYVQEVDLGGFLVGSYAIGQSAICKVLPGERPTCSKYYRGPESEIFEVVVGHEDQPMPVEMIGPTQM